MTIRDMAFFAIGASVGTLTYIFHSLWQEIQQTRRDVRAFAKSRLARIETGAAETVKQGSVPKG